MAHPTIAQKAGLAAEIKLEIAAWIDMFKPGILRRTMIGVMLMVFQQFQGINALIYYSPTLFEQLGLGYEMQLTMYGVLNVCQMVATTSSFFYLDKIGRKPPLLLGSVVNTISHVIVAVMIGKRCLCVCKRITDYLLTSPTLQPSSRTTGRTTKRKLGSVSPSSSFSASLSASDGPLSPGPYPPRSTPLVGEPREWPLPPAATGCSTLSSASSPLP